MPTLFHKMPVTVVKLGGSLLDLPDLAERLTQLLLNEQVVRPVIIPGGGPFADVVRNLDTIHGLNQQASHHVAVQSMSLSASFVANLSKQLMFLPVEESDRYRWEQSVFPVIDTGGLVLKNSPLPHSWDVTSDSITAWLASLHPQSMLVLIKSRSLPSQMTPELAAQEGLVDHYFPKIARSVGQIAWCNLRSKSPEIRAW